MRTLPLFRREYRKWIKPRVCSMRCHILSLQTTLLCFCVYCVPAPQFYKHIVSVHLEKSVFGLAVFYMFFAFCFAVCLLLEIVSTKFFTFSFFGPCFAGISCEEKKKNSLNRVRTRFVAVFFWMFIACIFVIDEREI